jgi:hypothetical protein
MNSHYKKVDCIKLKKLKIFIDPSKIMKNKFYSLDPLLDQIYKLIPPALKKYNY